MVGGLISGAATWASQRFQVRTAQLSHEISLREALYRDFIIAASKAYAHALVSDQPIVEDLAAIQAMITRMRIISTPRIVESAEAIYLKTTDTYLLPNRAIQELHGAMKTGEMISPLKDFNDAVHEEARLRFPGVRWLLSH